MRLALGPRNLAHIIVVLLTVSRVARALNTLVYNKLCSYVPQLPLKATLTRVNV
jgi:hypothetical protein